MLLDGSYVLANETSLLEPTALIVDHVGKLTDSGVETWIPFQHTSEHVSGSFSNNVGTKASILGLGPGLVF